MPFLKRKVLIEMSYSDCNIGEYIQNGTSIFPYAEYKFDVDSSLVSIAAQFNTSIENIMRINNINPPYVYRLNDLPQDVITRLKGKLKVPYVSNGGDSFEGYSLYTDEIIGVEYKDSTQITTLTQSDVTDSNGFVEGTIIPGSSEKICYITVNGKTMNFPCYPESVDDSQQASYNSTNILGRSEPFQVYTGSGPRTVSVAFTMHCEMVHSANSYQTDYEYVNSLVRLIESSCYPNYGSSVAAVKCTLQVAMNIRITGIITNVSTKWYGPIIDNKYQMVDINFSVTECTGNPKSQSDINSLGGFR